MGLDQSAGKWMEVECSHFKNDDGTPETYQVYGPFDWRKHARLHMFMIETYNRKHQDATDEQIWHMQEVELDSKDIDRLEKAIENKYYDYFCEGGFFFGHQFQEEQAEYYEEQDKNFVKFAKKELAKDNVIKYTCSW
tara:strand:+ start:66 stop:476 length:411 start_codon:yes stop_codon:yes gene_type:complete